MTSSSIQDISGLMYQNQVKGQKNGASDDNDLSGMFQNAMNLAKDNSLAGFADNHVAKGVSADKQQGLPALQGMISGAQQQNVKKPVSEGSSVSSGVEKETKQPSADDKTLEKEEEIVEKIAEELDVSEDEVKAAMEVLGLQVSDLMDQSNVALLVTQLLADGDSLAMLTDENMFATIKDLSETISELFLADETFGEQNPVELTDDFSSLVSDDEMVSSLNGEIAEQPVQAENADEHPVTYEINNEDVIAEGKEVPEELSESTDDSGSLDISDNHEEFSKNSDGQSTAEHSVTSPFVNAHDATNVQGMEGLNQTETVYSTNAKEIIDQIAEYVKVNNTAEFSEVEISLHPASLGNVHLQVSEKAGIITAVITTENEIVRDALLVQAMVLKEELNEQGLKVESVEVTVASHEFEQNMQQDEGQEARQLYEEQVNKQTRRRIMISGLEEAQEMLQDETLSDAERLQIDMMAKNGSSMDVMA